MAVTLDKFEYPTDSAAQAAWVVSADATFSGGTPSAESEYAEASQAVDGNTSTYWLSNNTKPTWWKYDFGAGNEKILTRVNICKINIGGSDQNIKDFTVSGSNDDSAYTTLGTFQAAQESNQTWESFYFNNIIAYRYYKVNITTNYRADSYCGFWEIYYTEEAGITVTSESTIKKEGSYSMKIVAAQTTSFTRTVSPTINLTDQDNLKIWMRASRTGTNFKIGLHDSGGTTTESNIAISSADTWEQKTIDLSAVSNANKDAVDSLILTITNVDAENIIYLDAWYGYSLGEYSAADITAAEAAQLATDQAAVLAKAAYIVDTQTILGQAGTLDMDLYVLISALPDKKYLYYNIDRGDGQKGTLRASNIHANAGAPGVDLSAAILKSGIIVDDVTGTYAGSGSGDYPDPENVLDNDTTDNQPGLYKEVGEAYVVAGITYGASSGKTGTYAPASSVGDGTAVGDALRDIYNSQLGVDAIYTPLTGTPIPLRIMLNKDIVLQPASMESQVVETGTTIEAIIADLGKLPARGETFTADGTNYTVQSISRNDGIEVEVVVISS